MIVSIQHVTGYKYSAPVYCEPTLVRLRPRCDSAQRLVNYSLHVDPQPAGSAQFLDMEGNPVASTWFSDMTSHLSLTATSTVETLRNNPFDYLLDTSATQLPCTYVEEGATLLDHYRKPAGSAEAAQLASSLAKQAGSRLLSFLDSLAETFSSYDKLVREEGEPWAADETLRRREGSCRDLTVLFNECCRSQGIAARFVSGYELSDPDREEYDLHAWSEVYVPGGGWRGYDPTLGLAVADRHVALAAAAHPGGAAPLHGTFRSNGATQRLSASIRIDIAHSKGQAQQQSQQQSSLIG